MRFGLYALLVYTLGLLAVGLAIAPAAAQRDFRPDNVAKSMAGIGATCRCGCDLGSRKLAAAPLDFCGLCSQFMVDRNPASAPIEHNA